MITMYTLAVSLLAADNHLKLYKGIQAPWVIKEIPRCRNKTLCPEDPGYTWESYFDRLMDVGGQSFIFGGYWLQYSRLLPYAYPYKEHWNETDFFSLYEKVKRQGGSILARLGMSCNDFFDETIFVESVQSFREKYPVSGFVFGPRLAKSEMEGSLPRVFAILKKLNLTSAISFGCDDWQAVKSTGIAAIADLNFYTLEPCYGRDDQLPIFNTNDYAREAIRNATLAGAKREGLTLQVRTLVQATIGELANIGYSGVIRDYNADPKGNGSIMFRDLMNITGLDGYYYFFSQTHLVDKVVLARKYKLHGVMLEGSTYYTDLLP